MTGTADARREALVALADRYGLSVNDNHSGAEDLAAMLDGDDPIEEWATVTSSGEWVYVSTFSTFEEAQTHGGANVADDIFAEAPVRLVNLDDGREWRPVVTFEAV